MAHCHLLGKSSSSQTCPNVQLLLLRHPVQLTNILPVVALLLFCATQVSHESLGGRESVKKIDE